jgi:hypothetical protein
MATLERLFRSSPKSDVALVLRVELALKPARHYGRFQGGQDGHNRGVCRSAAELKPSGIGRPRRAETDPGPSAKKKEAAN